jgi:hypothetical protein
MVGMDKTCSDSNVLVLAVNGRDWLRLVCLHALGPAPEGAVVC